MVINVRNYGKQIANLKRKYTGTTNKTLGEFLLQQGTTLYNYISSK